MWFIYAKVSSKPILILGLILMLCFGSVVANFPTIINQYPGQKDPTTWSTALFVVDFARWINQSSFDTGDIILSWSASSGAQIISIIPNNFNTQFLVEIWLASIGAIQASIKGTQYSTDLRWHTVDSNIEVLDVLATWSNIYYIGSSSTGNYLYKMAINDTWFRTQIATWEFTKIVYAPDGSLYLLSKTSSVIRVTNDMLTTTIPLTATDLVVDSQWYLYAIDWSNELVQYDINWWYYPINSVTLPWVPNRIARASNDGDVYVTMDNGIVRYNSALVLQNSISDIDAPSEIVVGNDYVYVTYPTINMLRTFERNLNYTGNENVVTWVVDIAAWDGGVYVVGSSGDSTLSYFHKTGQLEHIANLESSNVNYITFYNGSVFLSRWFNANSFRIVRTTITKPVVAPDGEWNEASISADNMVTRFPVYTINYYASGPGMISGDVSQEWIVEGNSGTSVTAIADIWYIFDWWSDGSIDPTRTETNLTGDIVLTWYFVDKTAPTATVSYSTETATNTDIIATLTGASEDITITNNSWSATYTFTGNGTFAFQFVDAVWNTGSTIATVNYIDKIAPVITLSGSSTVDVQLYVPYTESGAVATDNIDGNITSKISISWVVNVNVVWQYLVTYIVSDAVGNSTKVTRTVKVYMPVGSTSSSSPVPSSITNNTSSPKTDTVVDSANNTPKNRDDTDSSVEPSTSLMVINPIIPDDYCYIRNIHKVSMTGSSIKSTEFAQWIQFLYSYDLTKFNNASQFAPESSLTREQAAKLFTKFAINVLCRKPDTSLNVSYTDIDNADPTLKPYIIQAYQLGLMKWGNWLFRPFDTITKAEFNVVLVRLLIDSYLEEQWSVWYQSYDDLGSDLGIVTKGAWLQPVLRYESALMLYRAYMMTSFEENTVEKTFIVNIDS